MQASQKPRCLEVLASVGVFSVAPGSPSLCGSARALPQRAVIGMLHLGALPGTPRACFSIPEIVDQALRDAMELAEGGVHAILLENMHDRPYSRGAVGPEIVACMTRVATEIRRQLSPGMPLGIQILAAANREALAVAQAADLDFIRAEGFVFAHVADEGLIESQAADLLRFRRHIQAEGIRVYCDVKKKHSSHAITADVSLAETVHAAEFFLADGVIVTGAHTASPPALAEVQQARAATKKLPVLVGSGVDESNVASFLDSAHGVIVGSSVKKEGNWENSVDRAAVRRLVAAAAAASV